LIVAIVSALAAVGAVRYARRLDGRASEAVTAARQSAAAAERSAVASEKRAALESARRHDELIPRFWVSAEPSVDPRRLLVFLQGPPELARLDGLTVTIRDDRPGRAEGPHLAGGPTPEQIAGQIWGPFRFIPGTGPGASPTGEFQGADPTGRVTVTGGMPVGEELPFALEPTLPPRWSEQSSTAWRAQVGTVLRLQLEARREGYEPWTLTCEIDAAGESPTVEVP
jgi:hypothetical protein